MVSSQPQSTTKPVIRPQAFRASKADEVNDIEGTYSQFALSHRADAPLGCRTKLALCALSRTPGDMYSQAQ